ncbi:MAG: hypothetical protein WCT28_00785 [Patescibacteria group bacterium]|jgi:hypothetical protein
MVGSDSDRKPTSAIRGRRTVPPSPLSSFADSCATSDLYEPGRLEWELSNFVAIGPEDLQLVSSVGAISLGLKAYDPRISATEAPQILPIFKPEPRARAPERTNQDLEAPTFFAFSIDRSEK